MCVSHRAQVVISEIIAQELISPVHTIHIFLKVSLVIGIFMNSLETTHKSYKILKRFLFYSSYLL